MKTFLPALTVLALILNQSVRATDYYVSPSGSDSNPGTITQPFATPQKALTVIASGDTIYLRGGTYNLSAQVKPAIAGTAANSCKLWAYPGEKPVLNFASTPAGTKGLYLSKDYWHVKGIEVANATDNGVIVAGCGFNTVEGCVIHDCNNDGLRLGSSSAVAHDTLILNCDSYRNFQASSGGNNGDGFAAKIGTGTGNTFRGCRAWNNSDDGWDFYDNDTSSVTLDGCWSFANGLNLWGVPNFSGNGNGFKLGGASTHAQHVVKNCLAFDNVHDAFDQNHTKGAQTVYNCTAFRNGVNFQFPELPTTGTDVLKNNVSHSGPVALNGSAQQVANSWQGFTVTDADFTGLDTATATSPRNADFSLPTLALLHLAAGSDLIDGGVNVGLPFNGSAPDLGAFETSGAPPSPPAAPSSLSATAVSSSQINLAWTDNANNETGFKIERSTDGVNFSQIATVGANVTTFSDPGRSASTTYWYRVRANNGGGDSAYSNTANATTPAAGNNPPTVSLTAPANGATFTAPANITVSANAADSDGTVTSVAFFANGASIGTDTTSPYSIAWNNVAAGSYTLTAVPTDNAGAQTTSTAVNITVNPPGGGTTVTFTSIATEDGRVLESSESSGLGGSVNSSEATSAALRTGDDSSDRQYKSILSFDTSSIPDGATITSASVRMRRGSLTGTSPFTTHGSCFVDIKGGTGFNNSATLQTTDFQAPADATQVATMSNPTTDGAISSGTLNATGRGFINKTGRTQFRIYFSLDDNDNATNDYIGWFSGNDATVGNRPTLEVTYQ
jgi:Bacterial Ig domain/Pel9A-like, right handed beta helix region/Fibronectin type III domain